MLARYGLARRRVRKRSLLLHVRGHLASSSSAVADRDAPAKKKYDWDAIELLQLPLPPLEDTAARYLEQLRPLLSATQFNEAQATADEYLRSEGRALQAQLAAENARNPGTSFIKAHWDAMYLCGRYPVPINSNPFVHWHPHPDPSQRSQVTRAAALVHRMLKWRQGMQQGTIEPDGAPERRLCMSEYSLLFGTTRIPVSNGRDYHLTVPDSCHIVVLLGQTFHRITVVDAAGRIASQLALERALQALLLAGVGGDGAISNRRHSLADLTATDRDTWGRNREALLAAGAGNPAALYEVESAILHLCLDQTSPQTQAELYEVFLHGGKHREPRWYDKSISLICTPAGEAAINFEHSPFDGSTIIRMMNDCWHDAAGREVRATSLLASH